MFSHELEYIFNEEYSKWYDSLFKEPKEDNTNHKEALKK